MQCSEALIRIKRLAEYPICVTVTDVFANVIRLLVQVGRGVLVCNAIMGHTLVI